MEKQRAKNNQYTHKERVQGIGLPKIFFQIPVFIKAKINSTGINEQKRELKK